MIIGVTGNAGFIGQHVMDVAREQGHEVLGLDKAYIEGRGYPFTQLVGDMLHEGVLGQFMAQCDVWIHLAGILGTEETLDDINRTVMTNVNMGARILEAAFQSGIPGVNLSVGNHWMNNPYSISKSTVERMVLMYAQWMRFPVLNLRAPNVFGPGQGVPEPYGRYKVRKIIPSFATRALSDHPIQVFGEGQQLSQLIFVRDLAFTLVKAAEKVADGFIHERVIGVAPGIPSMTVREIAEAVSAVAAEVTGSGVPVVIEHLPGRPGDTGEDVEVDASELSLILGEDNFLERGAWNIIDQLELTIDWYEEQKGKLWAPSLY